MLQTHTYTHRCPQFRRFCVRRPAATAVSTFRIYLNIFNHICSKAPVRFVSKRFAARMVSCGSGSTGSIGLAVSVRAVRTVHAVRVGAGSCRPRGSNRFRCGAVRRFYQFRFGRFRRFGRLHFFNRFGSVRFGEALLRAHRAVPKRAGC